MIKKKIICLTPVKNESWILDKFLRATSMWADRIIIVDQNSTDGSVEIAKKFSKVKILKNDNEYNENYRNSILLESAREIEGEKILISLDADEFLSSNFRSEKEWDNIHSLKPGTIIEFPWVNVHPSLDKYWFAGNKPLGFVYDNLSQSLPGAIHIERVPMPKNAPRYCMKNIFAMHFAYTDWDRMESKHRWYQCWERINRPRSAIEIYRMYHHMYSIGKKDLKPVPIEWLKAYNDSQICLTKITKQETYWWDIEVINFMNKHGGKYFKKEAIWDIDWIKNAKQHKFDNIQKYSDPRNLIDKITHFWLRATQPFYNNSYFVKRIDNILKRYLNY
jgi:glycosyltransferase involved in cell wall biosynthesis